MTGITNLTTNFNTIQNFLKIVGQLETVPGSLDTNKVNFPSPFANTTLHKIPLLSGSSHEAKQKPPVAVALHQKLGGIEDDSYKSAMITAAPSGFIGPGVGMTDQKCDNLVLATSDHKLIGFDSFDQARDAGTGADGDLRRCFEMSFESAALLLGQSKELAAYREAIEFILYLAGTKPHQK